MKSQSGKSLISVFSKMLFIYESLRLKGTVILFVNVCLIIEIHMLTLKVHVRCR